MRDEVEWKRNSAAAEPQKKLLPPRRRVHRSTLTTTAPRHIQFIQLAIFYATPPSHGVNRQ